MASFTDNLVAFNPYIPQIPVDDYVRVGMIKQQQYNEGVQKVQGYIDSVAGLDVIKPEQKDYLQQRVGQLQGEVSGIVQRDFSNQQIVNSVGNLTSKMSSDPIIQNAVLSTHNYRQGLAKMKESQEKGTSSPANEYDFNKQLQGWLGDKDVSSTFNGTYTPYTDYKKKLIDALDKQLGHPDEKVEDIPYQRGLNGKVLLDKDGQPSIDYAMMVKSYKGVSPERVKAIVESTLDEKDKNQMSLDGKYEYRGYDKTAMKGVADQSYSYRLDQINESIKGLLVDRQTNINDAEHTAQVDKQIDSLKNKAQSYQARYKQDIQSIDKNLDGYKGQLYSDNWMAKFDEGFSYAQYSLTYKENPFFNAAEKRRENDIKYQEYMLSKQLEGVKIGIEQSKLGIEQEKLKIEQGKLDVQRFKAGMSSSGGSGGAAPLRLTGADIREPINQDELSKITVDTFNKETEDMQTGIDNQKIALIGQIRPDLVHVVRDANGNNAHYEYNIEGKEPTKVKLEAEASLGKIKDSYDKDPFSVEPGAKAYFDNLANTSQRLENRKVAITKLQTESDKKYDLTPLYNTVAPLAMQSSTGAKYQMSSKELADYNRKMLQVMTPDAEGGPFFFNRELADKLLTTPAERFLAGIEKKLNDPTNPRATSEEKRIMDKLTEVTRKINVPGNTLLAAKSNYMSNAVRSVVSAAQPTSFPVEGFKPEDRGRIQSVVGDLFNSIVAAGKENPNPNYDRSDISKMLDQKNHANTTYSLVSKGGENYALRLTNSNVTDKPREIDVTKDQAQDLFGQNKFLDDFQAIREALQLTKGTAKVTTDVQGTGKESAFNLNNGLLNNYGVKYHVEDPLKDGKLQVRLFIYDKTAKQWLPDRTVSFGALLDEAQVTKSLSILSDSVLDDIIKKK